MNRFRSFYFPFFFSIMILCLVSFGRVRAGDDNITANKKPKIFKGHQAPVMAVAFTKDNKNLISASLYGIVYHWAIDNNKPFRKMLIANAVPYACLSQDGKTLVLAGSDGGRSNELRIWNTTGVKLPKIAKPRLILKEDYEDFNAISISPDGTCMAAGDSIGFVRIWDLKTGKEFHSVKAHKGDIFTIAFAPKGKVVASGGEHGVIILSGPNKKLQKIVATEVKDSWVTALAFSTDGKLLASCTTETKRRRNCELAVWEISSGEKIRSIKLPETTWLSEMAFSPDNESLAVSTERYEEKKTGPNSTESMYLGGIQLWDVKNLKLSGTLISKHPQTFSSLVFSIDGKKLVAGCHDAGIYLWSLDGKQK